MSDSHIDWDKVRSTLYKRFLQEADRLFTKLQQGTWHGADTKSVQAMAIEMIDASFDVGNYALDRGLRFSKKIDNHAKDAAQRIVAKDVAEREVH